MNTRSIPIFVAAVLSAFACGPREGPVRPTSAKARAFTALLDATLAQHLADYPSNGRDAGLHEHDGKVADYSAEGVRARSARQRKARADLLAVPPAGLSEDEALDRALLVRELDYQLFVEDEELWRRFPAYYEELFSVNVYLDREYAPLVDRARRLVEHEEAALSQVAHVKANLARPLAHPVVEAAIRNFAGFAEYLRGDVAKLLAGVGDVALQQRFTKANTALADEAEALARHLRAELPNATASPALGRERFAKLVAAQEGLTTPLAELARMGEEDLKANARALDEIIVSGDRIEDDRPKASEVVAVASTIADEARKFLIEKRLVTIPSEDRCVVKETPPYKRWNFAFMDAPGPFETAPGLSAYYYVTPPDPSWPAKQQATYVPFRGSLRAITVHEVWPGHFLQSLFVKRAPTRVQKILMSYSFIEGWAHYTEQMMIEEGFGRTGPAARVGQLREALVRDCRFVVAFGMHTEGLTVERAERRFIDDCGMDPAAAHQQALRGAFDPGYFAYTLGKLQILALREEAKRRLGPRFSLLRFHDALLAHGNPPVALVHDRVLRDLDTNP